MRSLPALLVGALLLPSVAYAGYPYDNDDDEDYVQDGQQPQAQPQYDPNYPQQPPQQYPQQYQQQPPEQYAQYPDPNTAPPQEQPQPADYDPNAYSVGYVGPHPVPYDYGTTFCTIQGAHSHEYAPFDAHLFREYNGYYYFVGDPVDFGYGGSVYWFQAEHPVPIAYGGGYCYIGWPHRHGYEPVGIVGFSFVGGYWGWGGVWPADYWYYRDYNRTYYTGYYRSYYYGNRYYTARPPHAYYVAAPTRIASPPGRSFAAGRVPPVARAGAWAGMTARPGGTAPPGARAAVRPGVAAPMRTAPPAMAGRQSTPAPAWHSGGYTPPPASSGFRAPTPTYHAPEYHPAPTYHSPPVYHSTPSVHAGGFGGFHHR